MVEGENSRWPEDEVTILIHCRSGCLGVCYKEKAYYFGGYSGYEGTIYLDEWMELHLGTYAWRSISASDAPQGRIDHSMCIYKDTVFIFGGRANKKVFNDLQMFSITSEKY